MRRGDGSESEEGEGGFESHGGGRGLKEGRGGGRKEGRSQRAVEEGFEGLEDDVGAS